MSNTTNGVNAGWVDVLRTVQKVIAYITQGERLLVFSHPYEPEAGIQVPGGSVEPDESPEQAVLREAQEETALSDLTIVSKLGEQVIDVSDYGRDEIYHRHFYHVRFTGKSAERWRTVEKFSSDGTGEHIFELYWVHMPDEVPELIADQGAFLSKVYKHY